MHDWAAQLSVDGLSLDGIFVDGGSRSSDTVSHELQGRRGGPRRQADICETGRFSGACLQSRRPGLTSFQDTSDREEDVNIDGAQLDKIGTITATMWRGMKGRKYERTRDTTTRDLGVAHERSKKSVNYHYLP
jgi:hypothetical protein